MQVILKNASQHLSISGDTEGSENDIVRQSINNVTGWSYVIADDLLSVEVDSNELKGNADIIIVCEVIT